MRHARCWRLGVAIASTLVVGVWVAPGRSVAVAAVIFLEKEWRHGPAMAVAVGIAALVGGALMVLRSAY